MPHFLQGYVGFMEHSCSDERKHQKSRKIAIFAKNLSFHYSEVTGNEYADFTRCAARKAMDMNECMGQKCPFVSQPKLLPIDFRGSTSYVLSFFARAIALIAHAYSMMSVRRASNSFASSTIFNI